MIVNLQDVGYYFKDPVINSNVGEFDKNRYEFKGYGNFMIAFD